MAVRSITFLQSWKVWEQVWQGVAITLSEASLTLGSSRGITVLKARVKRPTRTNMMVKVFMSLKVRLV